MPLLPPIARPGSATLPRPRRRRSAHGEQAVFVYDRDSSQAIVYIGDAGWEATHAVVDGAVPDLVLSETERLWVRVCWQAATANTKEM
jgi:hypothetical protein